MLTAHVWTRSDLGVLLLSVSASLLEYIQLVGDIAQGYYDTHMAAWGNEPCPAMRRKKIIKRCDKVMNWTSVRVALSFFHTLTFFHFFIDISKLPSVRVFIYHHLSLTTLSGGLWPVSSSACFSISQSSQSSVASSYRARIYFLSAKWFHYLLPHEHTGDGNDIHPGKIRECTHGFMPGADAVWRGVGYSRLYAEELLHAYHTVPLMIPTGSA